VFLPDVPGEQRAHFPRPLQLAISAYHLLKRLPLSRHLLFLVGPLLYAVSVRNENGQD
jgi:hypothetical protein